MTNATQARTGPTDHTQPSPVWTTEDAVVVARLRKDANADKIDWRVEKAIGPAKIMAVVDELYPGPANCGYRKAYRIQGLIPILPEDLPDAGGPPPPPSAPPVPPPPADTPPEDPSASASPPEVLTPPPPAAPEAPPASAPEQPSALRRAWARLRKGGASAPEDDVEPEPEDKPERAWPILLIAASAFVAVWSGWVGLGEMTGFGEINLLPGFTKDSGEALLSVNTAITLPIGIEAYAAYALRAWLNGNGSHRTRRFAKVSGFIALLLGAFGQVAFHVLKANGKGEAPEEVTVFVSCLPVACIGAVTALHHMLSMDRRKHRAKLRSQKERMTHT